ncbi:uncharacterized protein LOC119725369 [Patiria miniata]|uniref:Uncharacterized protein n=1 Tax=Patiria miniata TaxID=46514 RepID=A0A913ZLQ3_PATMI|nr:uncharacterized protein LOC119725369 [Patiria miniata]
MFFVSTLVVLQATFWAVHSQNYGIMDVYDCGDVRIQLDAGSPAVTVQAPPATSGTSACLANLTCTWLVTSEPGSTVYVQILKHHPRQTSFGFDPANQDEVQIGVGKDPSNSTTLSRIRLHQVPQLDDGRVYFVNSSLAWVKVTAHARGPPSCVQFELMFTQREKPGICEGNTVLCSYSSVCLPASSYCDSHVDCGDFSDQIDCEMCGNTTIPPLTPGVPHVIVYAASWTPTSSNRLNPPHTDCFWLIRAPNGTIVEINVLANNKVGPAISLGVGEGGVTEASELLFSLGAGALQILYTNETNLWMLTNISPVNYYRRAVFEVKLTAFIKQDCKPDEFQCRNQKCVAAHRLCDGVPDCQVMEDEYGCEPPCFGQEAFKCPLHDECVSSKDVCSGKNQCWYSWDELDCGRCGGLHISLTPNETFNLSQTIDTSVECIWLVSASTNNSRIRVEILDLPIYEFYSDWTPDVYAGLFFGNGHEPSPTTRTHYFTSIRYLGTISFEGPHFWILLNKRSQTLNSPGRHYVRLSITEYYEKECGSNEYSCLPGNLCINASKVCDGKPDCPEYDDEFHCGVCGIGNFSCGDGTCLQEMHMCDGGNQCSDGSDEQKCEPCGELIIDLTSSPRSLTSIGYPSSYPSNSMCYWHLKADPGYDALVVFHDFYTEEFQDELYMGNGSMWLANATGERYPQRVALNSYMWLVFVSDFIYNYRGFEISVLQVESASCSEGEVACNGTDMLICILETQVCDSRGDCPDATDEEYCGDICGETLIDVPLNKLYDLTSPLYHLGTYPAFTDCVWQLRTGTSRDEKIILDILDFHLEQNFDYLHLGVGNDSSTEPVTSLTGSTKILGVQFESDRVWLRLQTDQLVSDKGFHFTLKAVEKKTVSGCNPRCMLPEGSVLCLQPEAFCDGFADCYDKSDEHEACGNISCGSDQYLCAGKRQCILHESLCDGELDCEFEDDEHNCDVRGRPDDCVGALIDGKLQIKCNQGWNTTTLNQIASITSILELTGGNATTLEEGMFKRFPKLRTLSLRSNNISEIKLSAFAGLSNLTTLDLSENNIGELDGGVFSELTMLNVMGMQLVPLQLIRGRAFEGLKNLRTLILMTDVSTAGTNGFSQRVSATKVEDGALTDLISLQTVYVDDHRLCCDFSSVLPAEEKCVNTQLQSPLFNCGRLMPNTVLQVFMWILGFSALIGNLLVIAWRIREDSGKGSKYVHSFLVLNLAMSDFLMGVYMVIIATVDAIKKEEYYLTATEWRNSALCKAAGVISVLSSEASVFFITLISVDRYLCIVHPFSRLRLKEKSVWVSVASIWMASLLVSLVPTVLVTDDSDIYGLSDVCIGLPLLTRPVDYTFTKADVGSSLDNDTYLIPQAVGSQPTWSYSIVLFLGVNLVCFLLVTICYVAIFAKVKRSIQRVKRHQSRRDEEVKMASKMAVIVGSDFLCWMPVIILGILSQTNLIEIQPDAYAWLVVFVLPINSSLNPYLYTIVTAVSRRRHEANSTSSKNSTHKPKVCSIPHISLEYRGESTLTTMTAPDSFVYLGYDPNDPKNSGM